MDEADESPTQLLLDRAAQAAGDGAALSQAPVELVGDVQGLAPHHHAAPGKAVCGGHLQAHNPALTIGEAVSSHCARLLAEAERLAASAVLFVAAGGLLSRHC